MINESKIDLGDKLFLFFQFPYDYSGGLPVSLMEGVDLISRPYPEERAELRYVLPQLNLVGVGVPHACIRISSMHTERDCLFWTIIFALQLVKPLHIGVSGWLTDKVSALLTIITVFRNNKDLDNYCLADLEEAMRLVAKIGGIKRCNRNNGILTGLNILMSVTNGQSTSFFMLYNALFSALEALYETGRGSDKARRLRERITSYLSENFEWIEQEYKSGRNPSSHGVSDFWTDKQGNLSFSVTDEQYKKLCELHKIACETILRYLETEILPYNNSSSMCLKPSKGPIVTTGQIPLITSSERPSSPIK